LKNGARRRRVRAADSRDGDASASRLRSFVPGPPAPRTPHTPTPAPSCQRRHNSLTRQPPAPQAAASRLLLATRFEKLALEKTSFPCPQSAAMGTLRVHYSEVVTDPHLIDADDDWALDVLPEDGEFGGTGRRCRRLRRRARAPAAPRRWQPPDHHDARPSPSPPQPPQNHPFTKTKPQPSRSLRTCSPPRPTRTASRLRPSRRRPRQSTTSPRSGRTSRCTSWGDDEANLNPCAHLCYKKSKKRI